MRALKVVKTLALVAAGCAFVGSRQPLRRRSPVRMLRIGNVRHRYWRLRSQTGSTDTVEIHFSEFPVSSGYGVALRHSGWRNGACEVAVNLDAPNRHTAQPVYTNRVSGGRFDSPFDDCKDHHREILWAVMGPDWRRPTGVRHHQLPRLPRRDQTSMINLLRGGTSSWRVYMAVDIYDAGSMATLAQSI